MIQWCLDMFDASEWLAPPVDAVPRLRPRRAARPGQAKPVQLELPFSFRRRPAAAADADEVDTDYDYPTQSWRHDGAYLGAPTTLAPRSVWELAGSTVETRIRPRGAADAEVGKRTAVRVDGVTRIVGAQYPADRMTVEKQERERARRARQKPPKPVKKARTRGRKLMELVGDDGDD